MEGHALHSGAGLPDSVPGVLVWTAYGHRCGAWHTLVPGSSVDSNRFGPEMSLAQRLMEVLPTDTFALVKVALGATTIEQHWRSPSGGDSVGFLYSKLLETVDSARAYHPIGDIPLSGFFWMQGESDAQAESSAVAYGNRLKAFVLDIRKTWSDTTMPWVLGQIDVQPAWPWANTVREGASDVAADLPRIGLVETVGFETDGIHYTATGTKRLGILFADRWLAAKGLLPPTGRRPPIEVGRVSEGRLLLRTVGPDPILEVRFLSPDGRRDSWISFRHSLVLPRWHVVGGLVILQVRRRSGRIEALRIPLI